MLFYLKKMKRICTQTTVIFIQAKEKYFNLEAEKLRMAQELQQLSTLLQNSTAASGGVSGHSNSPLQHGSTCDVTWLSFTHIV